MRHKQAALSESIALVSHVALISCCVVHWHVFVLLSCAMPDKLGGKQLVIQLHVQRRVLGQCDGDHNESVR